jgi:hypothetical protein
MKTMLLVIVCGASAACSPPPRAPGVLASDFCAAVYRGDMRAAGEAASEVTAPLDPRSVTPRLADWLRSLPCVEKVEVASEIIDTEPGIQEVAFVLRAKEGDRPRTCDADLHLAAPWHVGVHASEWVSSNPDTRCTPQK